MPKPDTRKLQSPSSSSKWGNQSALPGFGLIVVAVQLIELHDCYTAGWVVLQESWSYNYQHDARHNRHTDLC